MTRRTLHPAQSMQMPTNPKISRTSTRAYKLVTKWPESELSSTRSFAIDHFLGDPVLVEKDVEVVTFHIHADKINQEENQRR